MTIRGCLGCVGAAIVMFFLAICMIFLVSVIAPKASGIAPTRPSISVPLVDRDALAAHADSAGVPRAGAYALAWMETRTGACLPRCPRGPGILRVDSVVDGRLFSHRICREYGRMQINPCAGLEKRNPRCVIARVRDNQDDNYACGLAFFGTLLKRQPQQDGSDVRWALSRYNGGNPDYARKALAQIGDWWFQGLLREEDR